MIEKIEMDRVYLPEPEHKLREYVLAFDWSKVLAYGTVSVDVRAGAPRLVRIERTIRLD